MVGEPLRDFQLIIFGDAKNVGGNQIQLAALQVPVGVHGAAQLQVKKFGATAYVSLGADHKGRVGEVGARYAPDVPDLRLGTARMLALRYRPVIHEPENAVRPHRKRKPGEFSVFTQWRPRPAAQHGSIRSRDQDGLRRPPHTPLIKQVRLIGCLLFGIPFPVRDSVMGGSRQNRGLISVR